MKKITKEMMIGEIVDLNPKLGDILIEKYNLHCVGCGAAMGETLEEGAMIHGMSKKEIKEMVTELNRVNESKK